MRIVLLREIPEEPSLLRYWNELVLQTERPEVSYTPQWAVAIQSAFKPPPKPPLFLGYHADELVAVACLSCDLGEQNVSQTRLRDTGHAVWLWFSQIGTGRFGIG